MSKLLAIALFLFPLNLLSASIHWGVLEGTQSSTTHGPVQTSVNGSYVRGIAVSAYWMPESESGDPLGYLMADCGISYYPTAGTVMWLEAAYAPQTLTGKAIWTFAEYGDEITDDYLNSAPLIISYLDGAGINETQGSGSCSVKDGKAYLAFKAYGGDFPDGQPTDWKYLYGWVELTREGDHMIVSNSAFGDVYGLRVGSGAIPEPTSTVLTLVGFCLLALRRKISAGSETEIPPEAKRKF